MSEGASQARPSESSTDKYGLMSSIAAVREIILNSATAENDAVEELNTTKQQSYQEKLQLEEELQKQRNVLKDLGSKAEHAKEEAQREKTMRQVLEVAHSKLEDHRKELMRQLETTKASQAGMEEKIVRFREDLDEQNTAFEKERAKWEELVKVMRAQDESSKKEIGQLDARVSTAQQETKDAESQIEDLKKQVESADMRHAETVQLYKTTIDNLNKRIENGEVDTIESLQKRIAEAESNYETTLDKVSVLLLSSHGITLMVLCRLAHSHFIVLCSYEMLEKTCFPFVNFLTNEVKRYFPRSQKTNFWKSWHRQNLLWTRLKRISSPTRRSWQHWKRTIRKSLEKPCPSTHPTSPRPNWMARRVL